ncbi:UNVERIFIED_CONTAM: phage scaffolding protein, partial [Kocuria sp. CPCC 205274]
MKREFLKTLGLDDELINQIMVEHGKTLNSVTALTGQVETLTAEKAALTTQIAERDTQLTTLKDAAKDSEALTKQIADL